MMRRTRPHTPLHVALSVLIFVLATASAGARIAFVSTRDDQDGDLFTINPDGTGLTKLTLNQDIDENPTWSPDGRSIAFTSRTVDDLRLRIYTIGADGSGRTLLGNTVMERAPIAWSPDGEHIAYLWKGIKLLSLADNTTTRLPIPDPPPPWNPLYSQNVRNLAWSPDGSHIAVYRRGNWLTLLNLATGEATQLLEDVDTFGDLAWSPDSAHLVYTGGFDLHRVAVADGSTTQLTDTPEVYEYEPTWSPDGAEIAFVHRERDGEGRELWAMNADGTGMRAITSGMAAVKTPTWAPIVGALPGADPTFTVRYPPAGVELIPDRGTLDLELEVANHEGAWAWQLDEPFDTSAAGMSVPQGEMIVDGVQTTISGLQNGRSYELHIALTDAAGRLLNPVRAVATPFSVGEPLTVPVGDLADTKLAYVDWPDVVTVGYGGGDPFRVTEGLRISAPSWSQDGAEVRYWVGNTDTSQTRVLFTDSAQGGAQTEHGALPAGSVVDPAVSPDGSQVAFAWNGPEAGGRHVRGQRGRGRPETTHGDAPARLLPGMVSRRPTDRLCLRRRQVAPDRRERRRLQPSRDNPAQPNGRAGMVTRRHAVGLHDKPRPDARRQR